MALLVLAMPARAAETQDGPRILIIAQEQGYLPSMQMLARGITEELSASSPGALVYVEHLDLSRIRNQDLQQAQTEWLERKYADIRFDVIVTLGPDVLKAVREQLRSLSRDTPVVFWVLGSAVEEVRANEAGVVSIVDNTQTLALIRRLLPDTSRVLIVSGSARSDDLLINPSTVSAEPGSPDIELLKGEPLLELQRRVGALETGTVVFLTSMIRDRDGATYTSPGVAAALTARSNVPVFVGLNTTLGAGTAGGALLDFEEAGRSLGKTVRSVLEGGAGSLGGQLVQVPQRTVVDVQVLNRFGIPLSRVPEDAARINVPGLSRRYLQYLAAALAVVLLQGITIVALLVVRRQRERNAAELRQRVIDLEESRREQRRLAGHLLGAQENERRRVARELHDDITQRLSLLGLQLSTSATSSPDPAAVAAAAGKIGLLASDISRLSHRLHPDLLHRIGLAAALRGLCRDVSEPGRLEVECQTVGGDVKPSAAVSLAAYRVAQEALRNVSKHSGATQATVQLTLDPDGVELVVSDSGRGFDAVAAAQTGLGLTSMRERAEILGGSLDVDSTADRGSRIRLRLPVSAEP